MSSVAALCFLFTPYGLSYGECWFSDQYPECKERLNTEVEAYNYRNTQVVFPSFELN